MATNKTEKYSRIIFLMAKGCKKLVQIFTIKTIEKSTPANHVPKPWTIAQFLQHHEEEIRKKKPNLKQIRLLFPACASAVDIEQWDIQLLCLILQGFSSISSEMKMDLQELNKLRNTLCHKGDPSISNADYKGYLLKLKVIIQRFLKSIDDSDLNNEMDTLVKHVEHGALSLDDTINVLKEWYDRETILEDQLECLKDGQKETSHKMDHIVDKMEGLDTGQSKMMEKLEFLLSLHYPGITVPDTDVKILVQNCNQQVETITEELVKLLDPNLRPNFIEENLATIKQCVTEAMSELLTDGTKAMKGIQIGRDDPKGPMAKDDVKKDVEPLSTKPQLPSKSEIQSGSSHANYQRSDFKEKEDHKRKLKEDTVSSFNNTETDAIVHELMQKNWVQQAQAVQKNGKGEVLILCYTKYSMPKPRTLVPGCHNAIIYKDYKACSDEALVAEQHSLQHKKRLTLQQADILNSAISKYTTDPNNLMAKHSNLEMISASSIKSTSYGFPSYEFLSEPCIVFYCRSKSYVPCGETLFPTHLEDRQGNRIKTDVREGYFMLCPKGGATLLDQSTDWKKELSMGHSIGPANKYVSATIGIFVRVEGQTTYDSFLTAAHMFLSDSLNVDASIGTTVVQPAEGELPAHSVQNDRKCGTVQACIFDDQGAVGIDVALVQVAEDRMPTRVTFAQVSENALRQAGFTTCSYPTFDDASLKNATTFKTEDEADKRVIKFGKTTGLTKGTLRLNGIAVKITDEKLKLEIQSQTEYVMKGQLEIDSHALDNIFFQAGDSGAAVFQVDTNNALHFIGMGIGLTSYLTCIVTPANTILDSLRQKLNAEISLWRFNTKNNKMVH